MALPIRVLSIDPGLTGGLAIFSVTPENYGVTLDQVDKMPAIVSARYKTKKTNRICVEQLAEYVQENAICYAFIEHVAARPMTNKDGQKNQGEASTFNFGYGTGLTESVLFLHSIPFQWIYPRSWKAYFGLLKTEKSAATQLAREYWPTLKFSSGKADAALIGMYGIHQHQQQILEVFNG